MKATSEKYLMPAVRVSLLLALLIWLAQPALAKDTDIYSVNAKQNCYVLMDSSGSMNYGVYQHTIDYYEMFKYLFTLNDNPVGDYGDYIYDTINNSSYFYTHHTEARKIFLWKGRIGASIATVDGQPVAFSGDAANPDYLWFSNDLVDTHTVIDNDGNLADDGTGQRRLTVDASGYILLDGTQLPLGLNIKAHDLVTLYNGSVVDNGFNGLLNAPGYYFSGYEGVTVGALNQVESGDQDVYFFVTGNWANMQAMYNLHYTTSNPTPTGAHNGDAAWVYESFPIPPASWPQSAYSLDYPAGSGNYGDGLLETTTPQTIVLAGAQKFQIHFSAFDVKGDGNASTFTKDYVKIVNSAGTLVVQYDNDNNPTSGDGWSPVITGDTAILKLASNSDSITGAGYIIDKIRGVYVADGGGSYLMQSRLDVAKDALTYVVDAFRGKMNWGFASFDSTGHANGASMGPFLNPTDNDDTQRAAIITKIESLTADGGTPLMEALQDVFEQGYYGRRNVLDNLLCRKNYVISMTDGFPSDDTDTGRIAGVTFTDLDNDKWTQDPYQYTNPTGDFYDDVAHWMYTHSWLDKSVVSDPANSYVNVITHHIAFGAKQPMLQNAATESGGAYIVAYNKEQLVAAFYSAALMMSKSISFTAPVVSVDAVNKIQSGDELYMGLFLPIDSSYWVGNVKKFKLGDGSTDRPKRFMIYDGANNEAISSTGAFLDDTAAFWGDDNDANDHNHQTSAEIKEDGVGEVLLEDVQSFFTAGATTPSAFWSRPIYTYKNGGMVKFDRTHITAADLAVADDATRDKLINFTHGYTYDAVALTGAPLAVRDWILGPIIHSQPVVVDYFNTAVATLPVVKRLIVVGSNEGMFHVFDDTTGRELLAFIPADILPKLKTVQSTIGLYDTVDGLITLYRRAKNPKYLIFGERRGGASFWNLDVSNMDPTQWTVAWNYTNAEIRQSWSQVTVASLPVAIDTYGVRTYKDVAIFTGGYDPSEDNYPEPFTDQDANGTPYMANGQIDSSEWSKNTATQDVNGNGVYDKYNPGIDTTGRGIFVVDIDNPATVTNVMLSDGSTKQVLPFSVTYGAATVTTGAVQTLPTMKFSFPASPSVVTGADEYTYYDTSKSTSVTAVKENVLRSLYAVDVYANLFKTQFAFNLVNANPNGVIPSWEANSVGWTVNKVFAANPGFTIGSGRKGTVADLPSTTDLGRKAFYPPSISWGGSKGKFEAGNYYFPNVTFGNTKTMASLFFGTGDRENPKYTMIRNRFYAIYDDSSVTATLAPATSVPVTSATYHEDDLLNVTCDELGTDAIINSCYLGNSLSDGTTCAAASANVDMKRYLSSLLIDNAVYDTPSALEYGATHENDAKGWYIVLEDQGKNSVCSHVTQTTFSSATVGDHDNHIGEQVLSKSLLYYGTLYFTSYQPSISDPCNPQGNGFSYALNYLDGTATYDLYLPANKKSDMTDRYKNFNQIYGIPSGFTLITSDGHAAAMANMGESLIGPGPDPNNPYEINTQGLGMELIYWRDSNSQQP